MKVGRFFVNTLLGVLMGYSPIFAQWNPPRILKHPNLAQIQPQPLHILNSEYEETNMSISPDGKYLYFLSARGGQPWSKAYYTTKKGKPQYDGDIWASQKVGGKWQPPYVLPLGINSPNGEDEPNISPDGQVVYFQSWREDWERTNGPYYKATLNGDQWGTPVGLGSGITKFFKDKSLQSLLRGGNMGTDGASFSPDGNTFIFSFALGGSEAKMDLYISRKDAWGNWSYPVMLPVSTPGNERSPFIAADNKTLFFASDGYGGWGGLDILKTTILENNTHTQVLNIGAPFNTYLDDYGFMLTGSGDEAYFIREGDIYYINTTNASPELKPGATLMITGVIRDASTKKGTGALIHIVNPTTQKIIATGKSNSATGEYSIMIPELLDKFEQKVSKDGYTQAKKEHNIKITAGLNKVVSDLTIEPILAKKEDNPPPQRPKPKPQQQEASIDTNF
ncbi:MAG: hypothetical protein NZ551_03960 [Microscillaceae bacterium]|nr:hypothetical protein [Microscillaceae bacterium]MDW8460345.1 hypothetical protein [Cytophagales bacterium]